MIWGNLAIVRVGKDGIIKWMIEVIFFWCFGFFWMGILVLIFICWLMLIINWFVKVVSIIMVMCIMGNCWCVLCIFMVGKWNNV